MLGVRLLIGAPLGRISARGAPHWRNGPAAAVNRFTGGTQIRHFVMAITVATHHANGVAAPFA
jgi:hypothetical protein